MLKKNWLTIIGILFIVVGTAISYFAKFPMADVSGFAVTMFGAGLATANLWNKRDKTAKTWLCCPDPNRPWSRHPRRLRSTKIQENSSLKKQAPFITMPVELVELRRIELLTS